MAKKKRKPAQIQTKVHIFGVGNPKNRNPEKPFAVSKDVKKAADKLDRKRVSKKIDKVDESLKVKDQKLPNPKVPKAKVPDTKLGTIKKKKRKK